MPQVAVHTRSGRRRDDRLPLQVFWRLDVVGRDDGIIPIVLRLGDVREPLVAVRAVVIGLMVEPAEEVVGPIEETGGAVRALDGSLAGDVLAGYVDGEVEPVLLGDARVARDEQERLVRSV